MLDYWRNQNIIYDFQSEIVGVKGKVRLLLIYDF